MSDTNKEFERATSYEITDDDIARAKTLLGVYTASQMREHLTQATPDAIANFARGYGDDNPLFLDPSYGPATRWGSQVAPPMIHTSMNAPLLGDPIDPELKKATKGLFRGIHVFVSGGSWEWYRPVCPGDTIYSFTGNESLEEKASEFAGRSVISIMRTVKMNQRAEVVAIGRILAVYAARKKAKDKGKYAKTEAASYTNEDLAAIDEVYANEHVRGAEARYWEDVEVGESLGKMVKGPLTVTELIVFHAGGYGFTPYAPSASRLGYKNRNRIPGFYIKNEQGVPDVAQRVHWDSQWAQAIGSPMAYDYGMLRECWLQHFLTDWMGDDAWLARQSDEIRKFNYIGDTQFITGEVTGKREEAGRFAVDIALRSTSQRDQVTVEGTATVLLPSRDYGPVVLPVPPDDVQRTAIEMMHRRGELLRERG